MSPPYCPSCGCVITREGVYCQSCRTEYGYESDDCTCYSDCPEDCTSKLEHYCCCSNAIDIENCRAPDDKHYCICTERPEDIEECRANIHDG